MLTDAKLTELFVRRFDCAANKIKHMDGKSSDYGRYSGYEFRGLDRKASQYYGIWTLNNQYYDIIHPLGMMLAGKRRFSSSAQHDFQKHWFSLNRNMGSVLNPFLQGYVFLENYRDCWDINHVDSQTYHHSVFFNLGRALLERHTNVRLPYVLLPHIKAIINSLPK